jgi:SsrA-binding protein
MAKNKAPKPKHIDNKKARYNFIILDTIEAGIVLVGTEVKSLRAGQASIDEAFARIDGHQIVLCDCQIEPYAYGNRQNHEPKRKRTLLLHKRETKKLHQQAKLKGLTLIPLSIYFNQRGIAKVKLGVVKGKTHGDRRQDMKKKDQKRDMDRAMRRR